MTTISMQAGQGSAEANRARALELLDVAAAQRPDLACLPEAVLNAGLSWQGDWRSGAEREDGPFLSALCQRARRQRMYIVAGMLVDDGEGTVGNAAFLIDRQGQIAGRYDKVHTTDYETAAGIHPGSQARVFETDFGRVGIAICYDIGWPQLWQAMADQGAQVVAWPSAYDGGFPLQAYAWRHFYYVISSVWSTHSKVIDVTGRVLAGSSRISRLATATIDTEKEVFHTDYHVDKLLQAQRDLGDRLSVIGYSEENVFTLESNDPEWPVPRIKAHYGLESFRDYHARATQVQEAARVRGSRG